MKQEQPKLVLVVDDDIALRGLLRSMLVPAGYVILTLTNGRDAIQHIEALKSTVVLVILDLVMPGLNGAETFEVLRRLQPELPVLFISGFSNGEDLTAQLQQKRTAFLGKPFSEKQLLATLQRLTAP
jgi:CheY-like chemotaxis protein